MAELKHGSVTVTIPDPMTPPENAGKLTTEDKQKLRKPRRGLRLACSQVSTAMETAGERFIAPHNVTPGGLRKAGEKADQIDDIILDLEVVLERLKQTNLIFDDTAYGQLLEINRQLHAQSASDPGLKELFAPLVEYFRNTRRTTGS